MSAGSRLVEPGNINLPEALSRFTIALLRFARAQWKADRYHAAITVPSLLLTPSASTTPTISRGRRSRRGIRIGSRKTRQSCRGTTATRRCAPGVRTVSS